MDDIIEAIITLLETTLGSGYKVVYGRALMPAQSDLPMVCVAPVGTGRDIEGTGGLNTTMYTIDVVLYVDLKQYLDTEDNLDIAHQKSLVTIMEARDPTTRVPLVTSIFGALEANPQLGNLVDILKTPEISYSADAQQIVGSYVVPATIRLVYNQVLPRCP